jgi:hypothetical protein
MAAVLDLYDLSDAVSPFDAALDRVSAVDWMSQT